jgi:hypothetical protein
LLVKLSFSVYRRVLFIYATIVVVVALVLALGVLPFVRVEASIGATPQRAVQAFWINIGFNVLFAATFALIAMRSKGRSRITTSLHVVAGLLLMFLGFALADAGSAYLSHGPSMRAASVVLLCCAVADFLVGVSAFTTAFLQPKRA